MKIFQNKSDLLKLWSSRDGTGIRVEKKLKTIDLSSRKIEKKKVAVIHFGMTERCCDSKSCSVICASDGCIKSV
jgi:hypothetical protein